MNKVGNLMKQKRESMGLSIEDVVEATKIQKVYIDAIEKGDFSFFKNQDFYQQVFVGSYAEFLKLDKNEILSGLLEDAKNYVPNNVAREIENPTQRMPFKPSPSPHITKPVVKEEPVDVPEPTVLEAEFLQDYEVKSDPSLVEQAELNLNNEVYLEQEIDGEQNDEINQLIDEINQGVEVNFDEYFGESNPKVEESANLGEINLDEMLSSSILDDIDGINAQAETNINENSIPTVEPSGNQFFNLEEEKTEKTDVINLTSGIEIETVLDKEEEISPLNVVDIEPQPTKSMNEPSQPSFNTQLNELNQQFNETKPSTTSEEDVIAALENTLSTQLNINMNDEEPEKTSMDLKVAKALGDSKVVIDKKDARKIRRDKIIDGILIAVIVILIVVLGFFAYKLFLK